MAAATTPALDVDFRRAGGELGFFNLSSILKKL